MFKRYAPLFGFSLIAAGLWACSGTLEDTAPFLVDGGAKPTTGDAAAACNAERDILMSQKCALCHSAAGKSGGIDLATPGIFDRLAAQTATGVNCTGPIVDKAKPADSLMMKKVRGLQGQCGSPMPLGFDKLSDAEIDCLSAWMSAGGK